MEKGDGYGENKFQYHGKSLSIFFEFSAYRF